jgi:hypothetical protein
VTTGAELSRWWVARARCKVELEHAARANEYTLRLRNTSERALHELDVEIALPGNPTRVQATARTAKTAEEGAGSVTFASVRDGDLRPGPLGCYRLAVSGLEAGETIEIALLAGDGGARLAGR